MSPRWVLVLVVLLGAGIAVKLAMRSRAPITSNGADRSPTPGSVTTITPPPPQPTLDRPDPPALPFGDDAATDRPVLPPIDPMAMAGSGSPAPIGEAVFATEVRDDSWAKPVETEIRKRLDPLGRTMVRSTECKQHQCKLVLGGSDHDLEDAIAFLESTKGLQRYAATIFLTAPIVAADGSMELTAYAAFNRTN